MKVKKLLIFFFFLIAGVILGSMLASLAAGIQGLSWLAYGQSIGIDADAPFVLDLSILRVAFGLEMKINVAQILCIASSLMLYHLYGKRI